MERTRFVRAEKDGLPEPAKRRNPSEDQRMNPVVSQFGQLHFEGNVTPHAWYQSPLLQNEKGKPNLVAITLLADVVYWYRPVILRDEVSGREIGRRQKFAADKLQKNYQKWGEVFGLTLRQVEDAMAFLKRNGLLAVETRSVVTEFGTFPNCAFIEPVYAAIKEITFPRPDKTGDRPQKNGRIAPDKTGEPWQKNGRSGPEKREDSETPTKITGNYSERVFTPSAFSEGENTVRIPRNVSKDQLLGLCAKHSFVSVIDHLEELHRISLEHRALPKTLDKQKETLNWLRQQATQ